MGHLLSHPVTSKLLCRRSMGTLTAGSAAMQGYRVNMEDTHTMELKLPNHKNCSFFAVYDGHSGGAASIFMSRFFVERVNSLSNPLDPSLLKQAVMDADEEFMSNESVKTHGTTACFAIIKSPDELTADANFDITIGHVGDSRALLIDCNGQLKHVTIDHKPDDVSEHQRIRSAGGSVHFNRVDGELAMSRSIGDSNYKGDESLTALQQKVSCEAEISQHKAKPGDKLLICCDGLVEKLSNEQVLVFVEQHIKSQHNSFLQTHTDSQPNSPSKPTLTDNPTSSTVTTTNSSFHYSSFSGVDPALIMSQLCDYSLQQGSKDNMSCLLVLLAADPSTLQQAIQRSATPASTQIHHQQHQHTPQPPQQQASHTQTSHHSASHSSDSFTINSSTDSVFCYDEFVAGPYRLGESDRKFTQAYIDDARQHGIEGARLMALARQADQLFQQQGKSFESDRVKSVISLGL